MLGVVDSSAAPSMHLMKSTQTVFCRNCGLRFQTEFEDNAEFCDIPCSQEFKHKEKTTRLRKLPKPSFYVRVHEFDTNPELDLIIKELRDNKDLSINRYTLPCVCDTCRVTFDTLSNLGYPLPFVTLSDKKGQQLFIKFGLKDVTTALKVLRAPVYAPTRKVKRPSAPKNEA